MSPRRGGGHVADRASRGHSAPRAGVRAAVYALTLAALFAAPTPALAQDQLGGGWTKVMQGFSGSNPALNEWRSEGSLNAASLAEGYTGSYSGTTAKFASQTINAIREKGPAARYRINVEGYCENGDGCEKYFAGDCDYWHTREFTLAQADLPSPPEQGRTRSACNCCR